jgi:hypothetical protein
MNVQKPGILEKPGCYALTNSAILILLIFLGMNSQSVTKNVFKHVKKSLPNLFQPLVNWGNNLKLIIAVTVTNLKILTSISQRVIIPL